MANYLEQTIRIIRHEAREVAETAGISETVSAQDLSGARNMAFALKTSDLIIDYTPGRFRGIPTLWITDDEETARSLSDRGQAVLIYLHAGNKDSDFSGFVYAVEDIGELDDDYLEKVFRRFLGVPWDILETESCFLRESTMEDVEAFYEIYGEPSMTRYMENLFADHEEERAYIREYIKSQYGFYGFGIWTVVEKQSGQVIGRAGLSYREGYEEPELGFLIGVPWQGRGLATEVCQEILKYGRQQLGFTRFQAMVMPENKASLQVCGKLGFHKADTLTEQGKEYYRLVV